MKRVLMVAFHFPPMAGSSGIQRTLRFVQQLPQLGWEPLILSAHPRAYERTGTDLIAELPPGLVVRRAQVLDTARHLSLGGRYLAALARPDRWMSWQWDAVRQGLAMVRRYRPDALWTTYPIATAHAIGHALHLRTGLPWVADFRDPMAQDGYPEDPQVWAAYKRIEVSAARAASACCFTTPSAAHTYRQRYPDRADRMIVVENGYDEGAFHRAEAALAERSPLSPGCLTLLHSGIVYPAERDPRPLFQALGALRQSHPALAARLRLRFRAAVSEEMLIGLRNQHGVQDLVEILPPLPYTEALAEMLLADGLLVMQASNCNEQVPAKVYEYLRARRPIIALTDAAGDTWNVLQRAGIGPMAALDDPTAIVGLLVDFLQQRPLGWLPHDAAVQGASRLARTAQLARLLEGCLPRDGVPA